MDRRAFLKMSAGLAGLLVARPRLGGAATDGCVDTFGVSRASKLFPGRFVVHSDLHNHSIFSGDAVGDPETAYEQMLCAGLDVASLTEHAVMGKDHGHLTCPTGSPCSMVVGMNDETWARSAEIADAGTTPGSFVAIRGFEWTTGTLGHLNVWFTQQWTDALRTRALITHKGLPEFFNLLPGPGPQISDAIEPTIHATPEILATMDGFYDWLRSQPGRPLLGGGADGLAGFNHPNQYGNFNSFEFAPEVRDRIVTCEALNGFDDYLFFRAFPDDPEPISAILDAGWRVGMIGVTDEHGEAYGVAGKARGGLWVSELSRDGVREAMVARRAFATREAGLRLDAAANGVQMGQTLTHTSGPVTFLLDIAKAGWASKPLNVQVLRPGSDGATIAAAFPVLVPADDAAPLRFQIDLDIGEGAWVLLRVTDPSRPPDGHLPSDVAALGGAVAYSSPWFLSP